MFAVETYELTKVYEPPRGLWRLVVKSPLKKEVKAVNDVNLSVSEAEIFALIGPNGAGKTTLLKILATLIMPTSGSAKVAGFDVLKEEEKVRESIGFVSGNERSFFWRLTGRENLEFYSSLYNLGKKESKKRIEELLDLLQLIEAADNMYYSYSAGMKQKLALARALLNSPRVLLLDEPTKSLDPKMSTFILSFLREKCRKEGLTAILASHRLDEVREYCDRFALMDKGRVIFCGDVENLSRVVGRSHFYEVKFAGDISPFFLEELGRVGAREVKLEKKARQGFYTLTFSTSKDNGVQKVLENLFKKQKVFSFSRRELGLEEMIQAYEEVAP